jgi:secreted PhoX family phosphatase
MGSAALEKDHDKDGDVNHGSAASSRVLSRRKFLNVSVTRAATASASGLSASMSRPMAAGKTTKRWRFTKTPQVAANAVPGARIS